MAGVLPMTIEGSKDLAVRPPQQRRSREGWARILDAGVEVLEDGGFEAFTIAAVCSRASVPPRAIYARTSSKDGLFLAVYEHGMARVTASHGVLGDVDRWSSLDPRARIQWAVDAVAEVFTAHAAFLRAVVLVSGAHPEVAERGRAYAGQLTEAFAAVVLSIEGLPVADAGSAVRLSFSTVFAALVMRTAYGPDFAWAELDDHSFVQHLGALVADHLLSPRSV